MFTRRYGLYCNETPVLPNRDSPGKVPQAIEYGKPRFRLHNPIQVRFHGGSAGISAFAEYLGCVPGNCRRVGDMDFVYTFNALGTQLWKLLAEGHTESQLVKWVTEQYAVGESQALEDVRSFLADLRAVELVTQA